MSFAVAEIKAAVKRVRHKRAKRERSFDRHVEDIRCDIVLLVAPEQCRHIARQLAIAERTGIRSVWCHGLWLLDGGHWTARS